MSQQQQGANITYLRTIARSGDVARILAADIERACNDIEQYRELLGHLILRDDPKRLRELLEEMTWGNGFAEADYDRALGVAP